VSEAEFDIRYFECMAVLEDRHAWTQAMRTLTLQLMSRCGPGSPARVLDAGCGTGRLLSECQAKTGAAAWAVDLFPEALALARRRCSASLAAASADALPFPDGFFDAVHYADVLQHMTRRGALDALGEFARVLRQGGVLALRLRGRRLTRREPDVDFSISFRPRPLRAWLRERRLRAVFLSHVNMLPSLWAELGVRERNSAPVGENRRPRSRGRKVALADGLPAVGTALAFVRSSSAPIRPHAALCRAEGSVGNQGGSAGRVPPGHYAHRRKRTTSPLSALS